MVDKAQVQITKENFAEVLPLVKDALEQCQFYSFDCEMTGLRLGQHREEMLDDLENRYQKTLAGAQQFLVTQFGLSAFIWEDGKYQAKTYNFYVFPDTSGNQDRMFLSQASALQFLAKNNFDFNKFVYQGIPYMPLDGTHRRSGPQRQAPAVTQDPQAPGLISEEDQDMMEDVTGKITQWLRTPAPTLHLPLVNQGQRSLQLSAANKYGQDYPEAATFIVQELQSNGQTMVTLTRATPDEVQKHRQASHQLPRSSKVDNRAGFSIVLQYMRDSGKPAVGHNIQYDLAFMLHSFAGPLPSQWGQYKQVVHKWFPGGVYDTKYLSRHHLQELFPSTSLLDLYEKLMGAETDRAVRTFLEQWATSGLPGSGQPSLWALPAVNHAEGYEEYRGVKHACHEAGYDAFMTGAVFARLLRLFEIKAINRGSHPSSPPSLKFIETFNGRQAMGFSDIPYAALMGSDVTPHRPGCFYVSQLPRGMKKADISQRFATAGLGSVRITYVEQGKGVFVEVLDSAQHNNVITALRQSWRQVDVVTFATYQQQMREKGQASRKREARSQGNIRITRAAPQKMEPVQKETTSGIPRLARVTGASTTDSSSGYKLVPKAAQHAGECLAEDQHEGAVHQDGREGQHSEGTGEVIAACGNGARGTGHSTTAGPSGNEEVTSAGPVGSDHATGGEAALPIDCPVSYVASHECDKHVEQNSGSDGGGGLEGAHTESLASDAAPDMDSSASGGPQTVGSTTREGVLAGISSTGTSLTGSMDNGHKQDLGPGTGSANEGADTQSGTRKSPDSPLGGASVQLPRLPGLPLQSGQQGGPALVRPSPLPAGKRPAISSQQMTVLQPPTKTRSVE